MKERKARSISETHKRVVLGKKADTPKVEPRPWPMEEITQHFATVSQEDVLFGASTSITFGTGDQEKRVILYPELGSIQIHVPEGDERHEYGEVDLRVAESGLLFVSRASGRKGYVSAERLLVGGITGLSPSAEHALAEWLRLVEQHAQNAAASPPVSAPAPTPESVAHPTPRPDPGRLEHTRGKERTELIKGTIAGAIKTREQQTERGVEIVQAHFPMLEEGLTQTVMVIAKRGQAQSVKRRAEQGYLDVGTAIWLLGYRHLDTHHQGRELPRPFAWIYALRVSTDFEKYEQEVRKRQA